MHFRGTIMVVTFTAHLSLACHHDTWLLHHRGSHERILAVAHPKAKAEHNASNEAGCQEGSTNICHDIIGVEVAFITGFVVAVG